MPMATAVWLIDNTGLTFGQIADFVGVHTLEIQAVADGKSQVGVAGISPIDSEQLTGEEIDRCQKDPSRKLILSKGIKKMREKYDIGRVYVPLVKRRQRIEVIAWIMRHHPSVADADIAKLLSTGVGTVKSVRSGTHPTGEALTLRHPVESGFCSRAELENLIDKSRKNKEQKKADSQKPPSRKSIDPEKTDRE